MVDRLTYRVAVGIYSSLVTGVFSWAIFWRGQSPWWWALGFFLLVWHAHAQRAIGEVRQ